MKMSRESILSVALLCSVLVTNGLALLPEMKIGRVDLNDNVFHYTLIERIVQALEAGDNPLDCWSPEWSLGYPVLRIYQPLSHIIVAGAYFALGKTVSLMTLFVWARWLSVALLPLSYFGLARRLGLPELTAAAAAILGPLISTDFLYGVEYGSFTWAGSGLFPQSVATHLLLLAIGFGYHAIRQGRRTILAGVFIGMTLLCHLIYGYMGALSLLVLVVIPDKLTPRQIRFRRTLELGAVAFAVSAFQLVPLIRDAALINHSRWEPVWKWDSFGASLTLSRLFTGELLDHGRWPILTLLAFCGAALLVWRFRRGMRSPAHLFVASGAAFWMLFYCGRPLWGPLLNVLGASGDLHVHRVIGGAQIFLVLLAAIALAEACRELSRRSHFAVAVGLSALLLYPMVLERARNLSNNATWGRRNLEAYASERRDLDAAIASAKQRGGRAYAGLAADWGGRFKVGDVPFYAFLSQAQIPAVSFLYHSMALTGDIMVRFNDWTPAQYRLFNIQTVIAPVNSLAQPPGLLAPREQFGRFQTYEAPGGGYFDLVDAAYAVKTTRANFYDVNDRWLQSDWPAKRTHLLLDFSDSVPAGAARLAADAALPVLASMAPSPGDVETEARNGQSYRAECVVLRPAYALFKMTWHPNWQAYVDGTPQPVVMLSPGFAAVAIAPGRHRIEFRYEPGTLKPLLAIAGLLSIALFAFVGRRFAPALDALTLRAIPRRAQVAAGLLALSLPVIFPLLTSGVIGGHDSFEYFPRVIETHQNVANGILLPRWAPDLGNGYGQPVFIFRPPLFYWVAEALHLVGWNVVASVNLACVALVLAAAWAMFALGRLYYGETGGWLAAAAYLYAPYFAVDLYVRSALEEFSAFPLFALALYGFGAYARGRRYRDWTLGACAFAALLFCHFPAALLFTPVLIGFLAMNA
jgi:hypothetical protein